MAMTPAYYEIERKMRENGDVFTCVQNSRRFNAEPFCFVDAVNLIEEAKGKPDYESNRPNATVEVFETRRNCERWYKYTPGLGPKDHFDLMNIEAMEESRRNWELRLERERKNFDLKLWEATQRVQKDSYEIARKSFRFNFFATAVVATLALGTIILTFVQVYLAFQQSGQSLPLQEWFNWLGLK
jgi:hypothetical protein